MHDIVEIIEVLYGSRAAEGVPDVDMGVVKSLCKQGGSSAAFGKRIWKLHAPRPGLSGKRQFRLYHPRVAAVNFDPSSTVSKLQMLIVNGLQNPVRAVALHFPAEAKPLPG